MEIKAERIKKMKLLTTENSKTSKGTKLGYLTGILYLAPHRIAYKEINLCPASTAGCRASCLYSAGRGQFKSIQEARILKTIHFIEDQKAFIMQLQDDINSLKRKALKLGLKPCVRLNGTSDIDWQTIAAQLFVNNPDIQFYDYTKVLTRYSKFRNYDLTYSQSESNQAESFKLVEQGYKVARVVNNLTHYNGDDHDLRFLNSSGYINLKPKGKAKKDKTGFVK